MGRRRPLAFAIALVAVGCNPTVGERCTLGRAECSDDASAVYCSSDGTYRAVTCGGTRGCRRYGTWSSCDQSVADLGSACSRPGFACTPDGTLALSCRDGAFVFAEKCLGPWGCRAYGDITCDNDVAEPGDGCKVEGDYACTPDGNAALRCSGRQMVAVHRCPGPRQCTVVHPKPWETDLDCDVSLAASPGRSTENFLLEEDRKVTTNGAVFKATCSD